MHAHDPFLELLLLDRLLAAARREQRRLVDEVRQVGAGEPGRAGGERVEVDRGRERLALRVHLEDLAAAVRSGRSTTICRSKRPGRSSAGSRMSGRFVAR
jgi:hypothetical protein